MNIELNKQLVLTIRAWYFAITEEWATVAKDHGITSAQQHLLFILSSSEEPLTITEISHLGRWHISTVTRLLQPMMSEKLISITNGRGRFKFVRITEHGKLKLKAIADDVLQKVNFPLNPDGLREEQLRQFVHIGLQILRNQTGEAFAAWIQKSKPKAILNESV